VSKEFGIILGSHAHLKSDAESQDNCFAAEKCAELLEYPRPCEFYTLSRVRGGHLPDIAPKSCVRVRVLSVQSGTVGK
jgi:hypothetical protein